MLVIKNVILRCTVLVFGCLFYTASASCQTVELSDCFAWSDLPQSVWGRKAVQAVNGSGLNGNAHTSNPGDMWLESYTDARLFIDMHEMRAIKAISIWNYNETNLTTRGFKRIRIDYSSDCISWETLHADLLLSQAPGSNTYNQPNLISIAAPINCRYLRLVCLENFGDLAASGLSEVRLSVDAKAYKPSPANNNSYIILGDDINLQWSLPASALGADLYFGTDYESVEQADTASNEYMGNPQGCSYVPGELDEGKTYFWRVDVNYLSETVKGFVWSFTVNKQKSLAFSPFPRDFAEGLASEVQLSWEPGNAAVMHDVYVGTDKTELEKASILSSQYKARVASPSYLLQNLLEDTQYFWRIDEINANNEVAKGRIWDFTVSDYSNDYAIAPPTHLNVIEYEGNLNEPQFILLQTLAGVVAQVRPEIFISFEQNRVWLDDLIQNYGITCTYENNLSWYLTQYKDSCNGKYILYSYADKDSINVAASLSGILGAVACDVSQVRYLNALGYSKLIDVRGRDDQWVYDNYWGQLSHRGIIAQNRNVAGLDWSSATGTFALTGADKTLCDTIYDNIVPCSPRFGMWEKYADVEGEGSNTTLMSQHSMYSTAFLTPNLPVYTGIANGNYDLSFNQKIRDKKYTKETSKHYVTFIMSDMDNSYLLSRMNWISMTFNNDHRGDFAMGWAMNLNLIKYAPSIMQWWYRNASEKDAFITCLSGMGFMYPSMFPELEKQCQQLGRYMEKADSQICLIQDWATVDNNYFDTVISKYVDIDPLKAIIFDDGSHTLDEIYWSKGKPIIPIEHTLWEGLGTAESVSQAINAKPKDPGNMDSYSVVYVHTWTNNLDNVAQTIALLDSDVRVVTPEELVEHIYMNKPMDVITPVDANLTDEWQPVGLAIDGSGLSGTGSVVDQTHSTDWTAIAMAHPTTVPTFTFDLGALCNLARAYIWNGNMDYAGDQTDRGIQNFDIYVSSDSDPLTATWTLVGNYTIPQASLSDVNAEVVSFSATDVRLVKFDVQSNYGDPDCTTLSEVRFMGWVLDEDPKVLNADINADGIVNFEDFALMSLNWETSLLCDESNNWCDGSDVTGDSTVDLGDLAEMANSWLE